MSIMLLMFFVGSLILWLLFLNSREKSKPAGRRNLNPRKILGMIRDQLQLDIPGGYPDRYAPWIAGQALHETGDLKSSLFLNHNNLFGMKRALKRPTTRTEIQAPGGFANYNSIEDSITDYILWLEYNKIPRDLSTLGIFLGELKRRGYYEDSFVPYFKSVKSKLTKFN